MDQYLKKFWDSLFEANDRLNELLREIETQGENEVLSRAAMLEKGFAEIQKSTAEFRTWLAAHRMKLRSASEHWATRRGEEPVNSEAGAGSPHECPLPGGNEAERDGQVRTSQGSFELREGEVMFFREGDRIVKIGRSASSGKKYRHNCSLGDVVDLAGRIRAASSGGRRVVLSNILESSEKSLQRHQIYTALDWLRATNTIDRTSRGYAAKGGADFEDFITAQFRSLPEIEHRPVPLKMPQSVRTTVTLPQESSQPPLSFSPGKTHNGDLSQQPEPETCPPSGFTEPTVC